MARESVNAEWAEAQAETLRGMERAVRYNAWLLERSAQYLGRDVVDVGAGSGTFVDRIADGTRRVVAVEPEEAFQPDLQRRFAARDDVRVEQLDAQALAGAYPGSFDTAICFNVVEHIADDAAAVAAIARALKAEGHLLLLVPAHPFLFGELDRALAHERRYRRADLRRLLEPTGLAVLELRHVNPVGALGWLVAGRVLGRDRIPQAPLLAFDRAVPLLRRLDRLEAPFGLSLWAVARRA